MTAREIRQALERLVEARLPAFVWGPPGIGKSSIVAQIAEAKGLEFLDLRLALLDPTDLKGIPFFDPENRQGVWAPPSFLPDDPGSRGILFLDEINSAPPAVQASAYQLVLDRRVGEYELPEGWSIVAAGNRENDRGVVYRMPPPLANRFVHLEMEAVLEDWKAWAYRSGVSPELIAYLSYDPGRLFAFDPQKSEECGRTGALVRNLLEEEIRPRDILTKTAFRNAAAAIAVSPARAWRPLRSRPTTSLALLAIDTLLSASTQQLADLVQFATIELIDRLDQAA